MAQHEIERRKTQGTYGSSKNFFAARIFCDCCGETFTRKVWHSTSKYKRYIWPCGKKYRGDGPCDSLHLSEDKIKQAFAVLLKELYREKKSIASAAPNAVASVLNTTEDAHRADELDAELNLLYEKISDALRILGRKEIVSDAEKESYEQLKAVYARRSKELSSLKLQIADKEKRRFNSKCFLEILEKLEPPDALFNEALWCSLIDHASVPGAQKKAIAFHLRNGDVKHVQLD